MPGSPTRVHGRDTECRYYSHTSERLHSGRILLELGHKNIENCVAADLDWVALSVRHGEVSELADEHDLGSCAARRAGSSPAFPIGQTGRPLAYAG